MLVSIGLNTEVDNDTQIKNKNIPRKGHFIKSIRFANKYAMMHEYAIAAVENIAGP